MVTKFVSIPMEISALFHQILNIFIFHAANSARHYIGAPIIQLVPAFPVVPAFRSFRRSGRCHLPSCQLFSGRHSNQFTKKKRKNAPHAQRIACYQEIV
jgi:hypothetical protein